MEINVARFARTDETFLRSVLNTVCEGEVFFLYANTLGNLGKPRGIGLGCVFASAEAKIIFYFLGQELGLEFKWLVVVENWLSLLLSALPRGCIYTACCFPGRLNATEFMGGNKARKRRFEHRFAKSEFQAIFPNVKSPNEATLFVGLCMYVLT